MSKKHYVAIAKEIHEAILSARGSGRKAVEALASRLASIMAADNPSFSRSRFLEACGIKN